VPWRRRRGQQGAARAHRRRTAVDQNRCAWLVVAGRAWYNTASCVVMPHPWLKPTETVRNAWPPATAPGDELSLVLPLPNLLRLRPQQNARFVVVTLPQRAVPVRRRSPVRIRGRALLFPLSRRGAWRGSSAPSHGSFGQIQGHTSWELCRLTGYEMPLSCGLFRWRAPGDA
jgi:hypothetical protein